MAYKSILCPVDGTELGDHAMEEAAYLAKATGARLTLLHVSVQAYRSAHLVTDSAEWKAIHEGWLQEGTELLENEKARLLSEGVSNVEIVLRDGDAAFEIIAQALEQKADLIVMASHRYTPLGKVLIGSTIDKVTKRAPCPMLWVFK